jgi:hypothetical protein
MECNFEKPFSYLYFWTGLCQQPMEFVFQRSGSLLGVIIAHAGFNTDMIDCIVPKPLFTPAGNRKMWLSERLL